MADDPVDPVDPTEAAAQAASAALRRATRSTTRTKKGQSSPSRQRSTALPIGRDPQSLSAAVEGLIRDQGWQDQSAVAVLISQWGEIVGRDIAEHVTPVSFDEGVLLLQAESTAWATQVRLLLPQLHRAVDDRVGKGVVTAIRIQGPQAPNWSAGLRRVPGRGPRDTYG
jgi:predicted nucleic acid-binding Zn ribbon protein